jgi:hypothetical protein
LKETSYLTDYRRVTDSRRIATTIGNYLWLGGAHLSILQPLINEMGCVLQKTELRPAVRLAGEKRFSAGEFPKKSKPKNCSTRVMRGADQRKFPAQNHLPPQKFTRQREAGCKKVLISAIYKVRLCEQDGIGSGETNHAGGKQTYRKKVMAKKPVKSKAKKPAAKKPAKKAAGKKK